MNKENLELNNEVEKLEDDFLAEVNPQCSLDEECESCQ